MKTRIVSEIQELWNEQEQRMIPTRVNVEYPVDDAWILARQPSTLLLSASTYSVAVNGIITVSAQLRTPELADYSYQDLTTNRAITLQYGATVSTVNLVNGFWSDTIQFVYAGNCEIVCLDSDLASNTLTIGVS